MALTIEWKNRVDLWRKELRNHFYRKLAAVDEHHLAQFHRQLRDSLNSAGLLGYRNSSDDRLAAARDNPALGHERGGAERLKGTPRESGRARAGAPLARSAAPDPFARPNAGFHCLSTRSMIHMRTPAA